MCARVCVCVCVCVWPLITDSGIIKDFLLYFFSKNFTTNARALKREISVAAAGVLCIFTHMHIAENRQTGINLHSIGPYKTTHQQLRVHIVNT